MNYSDILKKIAFKEIIPLLLVIIILFLLITVVWMVSFKSFKKNHRFQHNELTKKIEQKKCIIGLILITVFSIAIVLFCLFDNMQYLHKIYKDINEESYITYEGDYYITSSAIDLNPPTATFIDVNLETNITLRLYVSLLKWFFTPTLEDNHGKIIYGENSHIIVNIKNS